MAVEDYQAVLNSGELFANPFPYGNMNGVVDVVRQGLPGVCLSGPEAHTHIDEGLFRSPGLPEALTAPLYRAVVRLSEERSHCRHICRSMTRSRCCSAAPRRSTLMRWGKGERRAGRRCGRGRSVVWKMQMTG